MKADSRWYFMHPDGMAVPACGYSFRDMVDEELSDAYEIPPAGGLLSVSEKVVSEDALFVLEYIFDRQPE